LEGQQSKVRKAIARFSPSPSGTGAPACRAQQYVQ
jgi:hypothetical protein